MILLLSPCYRFSAIAPREMPRRTNFNYRRLRVGIRKILQNSTPGLRSRNAFCNPFNSASARYILGPALERDLIVRFIVSQREIIRICRAIGEGVASASTMRIQRGWMNITKMKFRIAFIAHVI